MKVVIDEKACKKHKLTLEELLVALMYRQVKDPAQVILTLLEKEVLVVDETQNRFLVTQRWSDTINEILCDSACSVDDNRLLELGKQIKECFPKGTTPDGKYYYRSNSREIAQSLKRFIMLYGDYSDEDILKATKHYVEHFNGDYSTLRLAKYFPLKDESKKGGGVVSELATYLDKISEMEGGSLDVNTDWTTQLI